MSKLTSNNPRNSDQDDLSGWQRLGHGIHAVVWRARIPQQDSRAYVPHDRLDPSDLPLDPLNDLKNWVAIKVVHDICLPPHDIKREVAILRRISHRNIIRVLDFVRGGIEAPYSMYMPLIPLSLVVLLSSPLFTPETLSGPYSPFLRPIIASHDDCNPFEVVSKSIIYQLLLAVAYLHSLNPPVCHRDLSPSNVLIDESGTVKLIDFGVAWDQPNPLHIERATTKPLLANVLTSNWEETPDDMCSHVSTGPHRAPELLFSPPVYQATAIDRWSLGTTIAQCFTSLQLIPSSSPATSSTSFPLDENESSPAFIIPPSLNGNIDYRARWDRCTLFDGGRGELGLAWSIFRLRGTPNDETWPSFSLLPDVNKIEFRQTHGRQLDSVLPNLPFSSSSRASLLILINGFLAYEQSTRLSPAEALKHPYFSEDLLLPPERLDETHPHLGITTWNGKTLAGWLEPAIKREASRVTRIE
ncbi:hypothetical protein Clacol_007472 [Clathrus columnatus]|uniref:Protein kinase domain-containing protein n=1 Tax=Clathrus columnatus TaxID=1419009 RepID=A0AAV5ALA2_9AGAM|nr:hypothetical protein Clacol_007472 [Clathrus columnatus]